MKQTIIGVIVVAIVVLGGYFALKSNKDSADDSSQTDNQMEGRVVIAITDAAADMTNISEVSMTVSKVELHSEAQGWVTASSENKTFDLLDLKTNAEMMVAADAELMVDTYNQIRVTVDEVEVTTKDGDEVEAKLPSNEIKMNGQIVVEENMTATVLMDFLADVSLHTTGKGEFIFAPVVHMESRRNATAQVNADGGVTISNGTLLTNITAGMDIDGEVKANFRVDTKTELNIDNGVIKVKI